jgi:1,4-dihydroxy-2-naphthoyl-CoA synthase
MTIIGETTMIDPTTFEDVLYEVRDRAAWIIINRPKLYNAFRAQTIEELIILHWRRSIGT